MDEKSLQDINSDHGACCCTETVIVSVIHFKSTHTQKYTVSIIAVPPEVLHAKRM